ncbi:MAG: hypothetical protein OZ934_14155, partial [Anaerolineae bacterium]|nr:hypothetical protein [Anaerolineae bacterium]
VARGRPGASAPRGGEVSQGAAELYLTPSRAALGLPPLRVWRGGGEARQRRAGVRSARAQQRSAPTA